MLEFDKIRKDIASLVEQVKCLFERTPKATAWSTYHTNTSGGKYKAGTVVWYEGCVYKAIYDNQSIIPTNVAYWKNLGQGDLLEDNIGDWIAPVGTRHYIKNKPVIESGIIVEDDPFFKSSPAFEITQDDLDLLAVTSGINTGDQYIPTNLSEFVNDGDGTNPFITLQDLYSNNTLLEGGYYHISGYTYFVWASKYIIDGVLYTNYISNTVTLSPADPTWNRLDLIIITSSETITVIQGIPAENPALPLLDSSTELEVTFVTVTANTTVQPGIFKEQVYFDNAGEPGEWTIAYNSPSVNPDDLTDPSNGIKSIRFTNAPLGAKIAYINNVPVIHDGTGNLVFKIKFINAVAHRIQIIITDTNTGLSFQTWITPTNLYGIITTDTTNWQTCVIPTTAPYFSLPQSTKVEFINNRVNSNFRIDDIFFQLGTQPIEDTRITRTSQLINDGDDNTSTYVEHDEIGTVATTNSYNDLDNKPDLSQLHTHTNIAALNAVQGVNTGDQVLPTKTSDLLNDGNGAPGYPFITAEDVIVPPSEQIDVSATYISALTFYVIANRFPAGGSWYSATAANVTLEAANALLGRIDLLVANANGTVSFITGVPSATPAQPNWNSTTQYPVRFVYVPATATSLAPTYTDQLIFNEGIGQPLEWSPYYTNPGTILTSSDSYLGTFSITHTPVNNNFGHIVFSNLIAVEANKINVITFALKLKQSYNGDFGFFIQSNNTTVKGYYISNGMFGFNSTSLAWQIITIPVALANLSPVLINKFTIHIGVSGFSGFFLDYMKMQVTDESGGNVIISSPHPTHTSSFINDGANGIDPYATLSQLPPTYVHPATHPDTIIAFSDITTGNASITKHGYLPKLDGVATNALRGDGSWGPVSSNENGFLFEEFDYSGSQTFGTAVPYTAILLITVNGRQLHTSQYTKPTTSSVTITDSLESGDTVIITYSLSAVALNNAFNLKADLVGGTVPANQLPSYVDDVLEYADLASFPVTGENGKIYIALNTNVTYRWGGSSYVAIGSSLALGETSVTAYRGDRGKIAYDHSQEAHAPSDAQKNSDITKAEIEAKLIGQITSHTHPAFTLQQVLIAGSYVSDGLGSVSIPYAGDSPIQFIRNGGPFLIGHGSNFTQGATGINLFSFLPSGGLANIQVSSGLALITQSNPNYTAETIIGINEPTAYTTINFPAKPAGTYTVATLDDIGSDTSEWSTYTGTRVGNNMILEFGDYDGSGTSNFKARLNTDLRVFEFGDVDSEGDGISAGFNTNQFLVGIKTTPTAWGLYTSLFESGITHTNGATGHKIRLLFEAPTELSGRDLIFPNASGTIALTSDLLVDASGFNGNLTTSDNTLQEIAQKFDDLDVLAKSEIDTFAELNAIVADKNLVNLEDDQTFTGSLTLSTGNSTVNIHSNTYAQVGIFSNTMDGGTGFASYNTGSGAGYVSVNTGYGSTGVAFQADGLTGSIGLLWQGLNNGSQTSSISLLGEVTGLNFNGVALTTGGSATNFLNEEGNYVAVTTGSDTSEWVTFSGTRLDGNLNVIIGDYDNSGNGTRIELADGADIRVWGGTVILEESGLFLRENNLAVQFSNIAKTFNTSLYGADVSSSIDLILPEVSGTLALLSDIPTSSDVSEWVTSSGTRANEDLVVTMGDYDNSGGGAQLELDDNSGTLSWNRDLYLTQGGALLAWFDNLGNLATIRNSGITANRNFVFPDKDGTFAMTSDIPSSTDTSEWATYAGTRAGVDLVVTIGDYDNSGNKTYISIEDEEFNVKVSAKTLQLDPPGFGIATFNANGVTGIRDFIIPDASGTLALEGLSEWYQVTGTRLGNDLDVILGDYDDSGEGSKIQISQGSSILIDAGTGSQLDLIGAQGISLQGLNISLDGDITLPNVTRTFASTISQNTNTASRTYTLPNASGTIPLSVNGTFADANGNITISSGPTAIAVGFTSVGGETTWVLPQTPSDLYPEQLFLNGAFLTKGTDWSRAGNTITFLSPVLTLIAGEKLSYFGNTLAVASPASKQEFIMALSASDVVPLNGTSTVSLRVPNKFIITDVRLQANIPDTAGVVSVNVLNAGVSIFTTPVSMNLSSETSVGATTPFVFVGGSQASINDDNKLTFVVSNASNLRGLKITLIGNRG